MNKLFLLLKHPFTIICWIDSIGLVKLKDENYLKMKYKFYLDKNLNLNSPQLFNEKLQWLKINDHRPDYMFLVDKAAVKNKVTKLIGKDYIIPTIGIYENFDDIDFDKLPNQFVIKCTHNSGGVILVKDKRKMNWARVRKVVNKSLRTNYYYAAREWPYKNVKPRIIIEEFLPELNGDIIDYKFMCFNGKVKLIFTCSERRSKDGLKVTWFTPEWVKMDFTRHYPCSKKIIEKPKNLKKMITIAEKLSNGIPFVRIDLYNINGKIFFGEYTFYPGAGFEEFNPPEWDRKLGDMIDLSKVKQNEK